MEPPCKPLHPKFSLPGSRAQADVQEEALEDDAEERDESRLQSLML